MNPTSRFGVGRDSDLQVLWEDGERVFCRGESHADGYRTAVLAVLPAAEHPTPATLDRLAREYGLKDELDGAWALRPLELLRERGRTMLVLEDTRSEPLDRLLGAPMEVRSLLHLAIAITAALTQVHRRGLVHKDIKPANVLVNRATGEVKLTGFGIASRLPRERQAPAPPESIAGTLAYMAPEQTGRMNRSIDSRSDLYAFGVMLYQMLTGSLPFTAANPMEWVHCHIARKPVPPSARLATVPATLSALILKLLAKTAEERYQTAAGLGRDLQRCLAAWEAEHRIDAFPLGQQDASDRLLIPERLYGREREIDTLLAAFDRVVKSGAPELVLVSGYSGIGKSSVVNELHRALVPPRGLFASGKFEQYQRDIPYSTLAQAFQGLMRPMLSKSEAELSRSREALVEALGPNGRLMVDVVPELKLILGDQPPVPELPPQDSQRRFQLVFRRFLGVFARPEHPLALFLDDLHWLDAATLDLLEHVLTQPDVHHLLLVGAYRDNEVTPTHPLMRRLAAIRQAGVPVQEISLAPLGFEDVGRLISDALHCERNRAEPLARLVHEKTGGNPFFTIHFLTALTEEGLLAFDHGKARWSWDLDRIQATGFTDNVVELMLGKLSRLPVETRAALQQLACLGNAATATLSVVHGGTEAALHAALWEAVRAGLVFRHEGAYRFLHDRVQEAAYALIPADEQAAEHLRIGRLLAARTAPQAIEENVFEIVRQLNRGAALLTSGEERERLAELNLLAGKRAKAATAYTSALTYFVAGAALMPEDSWERRHKLMFQLELHRAECEYLTSALADAENRLTVLSSRAGDLLDLAAVTCLQEDLYTTLDRSDRSVEVALDYLRRVGVAWSAHPAQDEVRRELERMWQQIGSRPIEALLDLPRMADPVWRATMDVLSAAVSPAMYTDENLYGVVLGRMANLSLEHGNTDASSSAYAILGAVLGGLFGDYKAGFRFGQLGFNLVAKLGLDRFKARVYLFFGHHILPWTKPIRTGRSLIQLAIDAAQEIGDLIYGAFARAHLVTHLLASGDALDEVQRKAEAGLDVARQARFGIVVDRITGQLQLIRTLRGLTPVFGCFNDAGFDEERFEQHLGADPRLALAACWYWIRKLQARVLAGDHVGAIAAAAQADGLLWTSPFYFERAEYHFYAALARAALCDAARDAERTRHLEALAAHHRQLQEWAENCPENFGNRAALVGAEIARLDGRELDAERLYEQAIHSARANGCVFAGRPLRLSALGSRWQGAPPRRDVSTPQGGRAGASSDEHDRGIGRTPRPRDRDQGIAGRLGRDRPGNADRHAHAHGHRAGRCRAGSVDHSARGRAADRGGSHDGRRHGRRAAARPARDRGRAAGDGAPLCSAHPRERHPRRCRRAVPVCRRFLHPRAPGAVHSLPALDHPGQASRIAVLKLLASQAAIALENARLYRDLAERESKIRRLVDANIIGIFFWDVDGRILEANDTFLRMVGCDREELVSGRVRWSDLTPPEWRERSVRSVEEVRLTGSLQPYEKEYFRKDGSRVPVLIGSAAFDEQRDQGVAFLLDLTERKRAEAGARESERRYRELQMEVAHANRVATMGQLTASIAHEVNQPIAATAINAEAALRWLGPGPPDLEEVRQALRRIVKDAKRAGDVIGRIRAIIKRAPPRKDWVDMNEAIREVIEITRGEAAKNGASVQTALGEGLPRIEGDRVQLQQVVLNLIVNAVQAMCAVAEGARELCITTARGEPNGIVVVVKDSGPGLAPARLEQLFSPFYTTKPGGLGMGLSICRSIIEAHGGRLWVTANVPQGAIFPFTVPARAGSAT